MTLPPFLTAKPWLLEPSGLVCCVLLEQRRLEPRRGDRLFPRRQSSDNLASGTTGSNLLSSTGESISGGSLAGEQNLTILPLTCQFDHSHPCRAPLRIGLVATCCCR